MIFSPDPSRPYQKPEAGSIGLLLKDRAGKNADAVAICAPGRPPLTYDRLFKQVERTVHALRALGVSRNDRVAMVLPNGPEMAVAFAAVSSAATCAPLNPSYRTSELEFYFSDLNARTLIISSNVDSPAREVARKLNIQILELTPGVGAGTFDLSGEIRAAACGDGFSEPGDTALVLHTSGTTARPKIVPLTHVNVCSSGHNIALTLELEKDDRCLNVMPLFHIHGLIGAVLSSLTAGASVVCTPGLDVGKFFEWLDTFRPTWYSAVPTMHQAILARASANREIVARCPMRFIRSSSAPLPRRVMAALEEDFAAPVIESYGMTEAAHQMTSNPVGGAARKASSVGIASGPDVAIMDEAGRLLPIGDIGEVVVRGANVTAGYENNPTANQGAFTNGWFRTGDQGRIDTDGFLFLTGRLKEVINRGGEKIAPKELDDVLAQHPAVADAIAFSVSHPTLGEDIAAAVVLHKDAVATEGDIRDFAAARLASFKVPSRIVIVEEIPKGPTGKLQRNTLADALRSRLQAEFIAAETAVEAQLTEVWMGLLEVDRVGLRDNFFALGGDSLALAELMLEIEGRFGKRISVDAFLQTPTIEGIAKSLQGAGAQDSEASAGARPMTDSVLVGIKNRLLQLLALYAPGFKTVRVWLHRLRGVSIGKNVSIGQSVLIETAYPRLVSIGDNVSIGMRAVVIGHLRDLTTQAKTSHLPTVRIENDVYIGPGVIVLPNVTIGHGAVVSAGSVVSSSIPPQVLVRGNPARPIARCGVSLGGGVSYEEFLRHLTPLKEHRRA